MKAYFLKLHWQILLTKIDEEPYSSEYALKLSKSKGVIQKFIYDQDKEKVFNCIN